MPRLLKVSLIAVIALTVMLAVVPVPASAGVVVGRSYWVGPGWGWGWGPGWYARPWGPAYYPYYYRPYGGTVKIITPEKHASVYVDGGYAGTVKHMHKFSLRPGPHDISLRAENGETIFNQRVEVLRGRTTEIRVPA